MPIKQKTIVGKCFSIIYANRMIYLSSLLSCGRGNIARLHWRMCWKWNVTVLMFIYKFKCKFLHEVFPVIVPRLWYRISFTWEPSMHWVAMFMGRTCYPIRVTSTNRHKRISDLRLTVSKEVLIRKKRWGVYIPHCWTFPYCKVYYCIAGIIKYLSASFRVRVKCFKSELRLTLRLFCILIKWVKNIQWNLLSWPPSGSTFSWST